MKTCCHVWGYLMENVQRCQQCGLERATLEGTVCLHPPNAEHMDWQLYVQAIDGNDIYSVLLPFTERRVRVTVETLD